MDDKKKMESEFIQLIMGLESSGWMTLGKIANPITGQLEQNLSSAQGIIDTLLMLKEKTQGNLSKTEEQVLNGALSNLQINYVEETTRELQEQKEAEDQKQVKTEEKVMDTKKPEPKVAKKQEK